jgi:AhpD family alkylhydroperoxidase
MTEVTPSPGTAGAVPVIAGDISLRIEQGGHQPLISDRKRGSTRYLLAHWRDVKAIWVDERLDPVFREEIMLAVASANSCRQCSYAHREWALAEGLSEAQIAALEGLDEEAFDARTWSAIAWAQATARSGLGEAPEIITTNFKERFDKRERSDINVIVRVMYWCNEISNAVDAAWSRVKGRPVKGSDLSKEIEAVILYVLFVPGLFLFLSAKRRRRPRELIRGARPFFRQFQMPPDRNH